MSPPRSRAPTRGARCRLRRPSVSRRVPPRGPPDRARERLGEARSGSLPPAQPPPLPTSRSPSPRYRAPPPPRSPPRPGCRLLVGFLVRPGVGRPSRVDGRLDACAHAVLEDALNHHGVGDPTCPVSPTKTDCAGSGELARGIAIALPGCPVAGERLRTAIRSRTGDDDDRVGCRRSSSSQNVRTHRRSSASLGFSAISTCDSVRRSVGGAGPAGVAGGRPRSAPRRVRHGAAPLGRPRPGTTSLPPPPPARPRAVLAAGGCDGGTSRPTATRPCRRPIVQGRATTRQERSTRASTRARGGWRNLRPHRDSQSTNLGLSSRRS